MELDGRRDAANCARHLFGRVGLDHRLTHYPRQLSGGEQQLVAIARAFASDPAILFADETNGNLDAATGARITDLLTSASRVVPAMTKPSWSPTPMPRLPASSASTETRWFFFSSRRRHTSWTGDWSSDVCSSD